MKKEKKQEHKSNLESALSFIKEIDALRNVKRNTKVMSVDRRENSAEHSWHLAVMAMVLSETANSNIDLNKVIKMLLVHDLPEIYADDVLVYDRTEAHEAKEREAADKLFCMLPDNLRVMFRDLWEEFEAGETEEAKFAKALDRFQPCFCNFQNDGKMWYDLGVSSGAVLKHNSHVADGSEILWQEIQDMVETGKERGFFPDEKDVKYA